ncbi:MAG: tyrosine--tRNA ligase [Candidatus Shikimatogenerans bostrichidophilus]|nr:MAG: tyrosine--tRNA ligase [Candidatus Shikimatogenerans bostrichidophilus]
MKNKILKELIWRNLIYNYTKNINILFNSKKITLYIGFDPTFYSLHIGHLIPLSIIIRLYKYKIIKKIYIIIGKSTAIIGDINNNNNYNKYINNYIKLLKLQIKKILYKKIKKNIIYFLNNYNWIKNIKLLKFLNNFSNYISINFMLKKKIIKNNLKNNININFSKFTYSLLQGYDYYYLNKKYNCNLQIGGSDQWTNIITGIYLIKKKLNKNLYGFTFPLLLNNNNKKFSKSNINNNIWLNKKLTNIYNLYQFLINLSDNNSIKYIKYFSFFKKKKTLNLIKYHFKNTNKKILQKIITKLLIKWIYNKKIYKNIKYITNLLFYKKFKINYIKKNINLLKKYINYYIIYYNKNINNINIFYLIKKNILFNSNTNFKKFIYNNGLIYINGKLINNKFLITNFKNLINKKYIFIKIGKKQHYLIKFIKYE